MLISPPFLHPDRMGAAHPNDDAQFVDDAMPNVAAYHGLSGNFPISYNLGWHGGRHIGANLDGTIVPVRAIADGVLCYRREPTKKPTDGDALKNHPLNYRGLWTDDGVVILQHTTEIGEGVSVTFYSLYAHLSELKLTAQPGDRVYRKDVLGRAGAITGQTYRIHFEIIADEDNLKRLIPGPFNAYDPSKAHGRNTCVWGDIYFHVPAGQPVYRRNPREIVPQDYTIQETDTLDGIAQRFGTTVDVLAQLNRATHQRYRPQMSYEQWFAYQRSYVDTAYAGPHLRIMQVPQRYDTTVSATEDRGPNPVLHPYATTAQPMIVGMHLFQGGTFTTYGDDGSVLGLTRKPDEEHNLYATAQHLYPHCASAGYELLRFGRVLGPDALHPKDRDSSGRHTHFREVYYTTASGSQDRAWINLYDEAIHVFSDADFAPVFGWQKADDDTNGDSRCDSNVVYQQLIHAWTDQNPDKVQAGVSAINALGREISAALRDPVQKASSVADAAQSLKQVLDQALITELLNDETVQAKLGQVVCKFPSEWDFSQFDQRWGWLSSDPTQDDNAPPSDGTAPQPAPRLMPEQMQKFKAHAQALCFWEQAKQAGYLDIDANHWHIDPRVFIKQFRKCGWLSESELTQTLPMSALRQSRGQWVSEPINLTQARTRNIQRIRIELNRSLRKFNIAPSPLRMAAFIANALVETQWFETLYENNRAAWYYPWDGRGFLQLTGPGNYIKYWRFLGRTVPESLEKELSTAASKAHTEQKNDELKDTKHPDLDVQMIQWRNDVDREPYDAAQSAGAYWAWTQAAKFADQWPTWQRVTKYAENDKTTNVYYCSDSFGQVAATVNFGSPVRDARSIAKVNGIVARYQAYTYAMATLGDGLGFPDANGQSQEMPDGYERRKL